MGRQLRTWVLAAALAAGCTGVGAPEPTYAPLSAVPPGASAVPAAGATSSAGSVETPEPSAVAATWSSLATLPDGAWVVITGRVKAGFMVSCFNRVCGIDLEDAAGGSGSAILDVATAATRGVPNTMAALPDPYTEADLHLTADDGTAIASGDVVTVVGTIRQGDGYTVVNLRRLSSAPKPAPTASLAPRTVSFATLAGLPKGTLVRVRGNLSLPYFTFCDGRVCSIELDDPASSRVADLFVTQLGSGDARRNGMTPLPSKFKNSDLAVYTASGKRLGYNALAWITGTLDNEASAKVRDIDVTGIEPAK